MSNHIKGQVVLTDQYTSDTPWTAKVLIDASPGGVLLEIDGSDGYIGFALEIWNGQLRLLTWDKNPEPDIYVISRDLPKTIAALNEENE